MSLIHDAIRRAERDSPGEAPGLGGALSVGAAPASWTRPVVIAVASALGLSTLAWWHWQRASLSTVVVTGSAHSAAIVVTPRLELGMTEAQPEALPLVPALASRSLPVAQKVSAAPAHQTYAPAAAAAPETGPVVPPQSAEKAVQAAVVVQAKVVDAVASQRPTTSLDVQQHLLSFVQKMKAGDIAQAKTELLAIQEKTPVSAVVRLRAEAWYALGSGNVVAARAAYQHLLDRFPGDEEASINLASIEASANHQVAARATLGDALRSNPESGALRDALYRFNAVGRR